LSLCTKSETFEENELLELDFTLELTGIVLSELLVLFGSIGNGKLGLLFIIGVTGVNGREQGSGVVSATDLGSGVVSATGLSSLASSLHVSHR
jgi:hypothetical protein